MQALRAGGLPVREAFDLLLDAAPTERLAAKLAVELQQREGRGVGARRLPAWAAIAATLVIFVAGIAAGYGLRSIDIAGLLQSRAEKDEADAHAWNQMLASNLALYTPEALAMIGHEQAPGDASLKVIGAELDIVLSVERLTFPDLELKQARLLVFRSTPFVQLIYLDRQHRPIGFCIYRRRAGSEGLEDEHRAGMNLVYWAGKRAGYTLLGRAPMSELYRHAAVLAKRFPPSSM
ncbi:MAG TPA: hypothetical protein VE175_11900 [Woeseiaceae bacterium]|nr:hypothetical protein [Woeseiaceae bacterium]